MWSHDGVAQCLLVVPESSLEAAVASNVLSGLRGMGLGSVYPDLRVLDLTWEYFSRATEPISIPRENRALVEYVVHSQQLGQYERPGWRKHVLALEGKEVSDRGNARLASARAVYATRFGEEGCRFDCELPQTRQGEGSWQVRFEHEVLSPFGARLPGMQISARLVELSHLTAGFKEAAQAPAQILKEWSGGFDFHWANQDFRYSRMGIERQQSRNRDG